MNSECRVYSFYSGREIKNQEELENNSIVCECWKEDREEEKALTELAQLTKELFE